MQKPHVTKVVCGEEHTIVLSQQGQVWCWGNNKNFQLGVGKSAGDRVERIEMVGNVCAL